MIIFLHMKLESAVEDLNLDKGLYLCGDKRNGGKILFYSINGCDLFNNQLISLIICR